MATSPARAVVSPPTIRTPPMPPGANRGGGGGGRGGRDGSSSSGDAASSRNGDSRSQSSNGNGNGVRAHSSSAAGHVKAGEDRALAEWCIVHHGSNRGVLRLREGQQYSMGRDHVGTVIPLGVRHPRVSRLQIKFTVQNNRLRCKCIGRNSSLLLENEHARRSQAQRLGNGQTFDWLDGELLELHFKAPLENGFVLRKVPPPPTLADQEAIGLDACEELTEADANASPRDAAQGSVSNSHSKASANSSSSSSSSSNNNNNNNVDAEDAEAFEVLEATQGEEGTPTPAEESTVVGYDHSCESARKPYKRPRTIQLSPSLRGSPLIVVSKLLIRSIPQTAADIVLDFLFCCHYCHKLLDETRDQVYRCHQCGIHCLSCVTPGADLYKLRSQHCVEPAPVKGGKNVTLWSRLP